MPENTRDTLNADNISHHHTFVTLSVRFVRALAHVCHTQCHATSSRKRTLVTLNVEIPVYCRHIPSGRGTHGEYLWTRRPPSGADSSANLMRDEGSGLGSETISGSERVRLSRASISERQPGFYTTCLANSLLAVCHVLSLLPISRIYLLCLLRQPLSGCHAIRIIFSQQSAVTVSFQVDREICFRSNRVIRMNE